MTKDEALKLALEALEWCQGGEPCGTAAAIAAVKEALAAPTSADYAMGYAEGFNDGCKPAPVQEPVAWRRREVGGCWQYFGWEEAGMTYQCVERWNKNGFECEAIPATPPLPVQRQPLGWAKQSEIDYQQTHGGTFNVWLRKFDCDTPIYAEAAHAPLPVQEPVAEAYALADKVRTELDKQSCPGVYMNIAWEAIVKNYRDLIYSAPPLPVQPEERNFCQRCGKRTADPTTIHTCTPPRENI
jgi:hypothetical protein